MSTKPKKPYAQKHDPNIHADQHIEKALKDRGADREVPCALAFEIAAGLGVTPEAVGRTADVLDIPLVECQLGLFGYKPEKKIIKAEDTANRELKAALLESSQDLKLACATAWQIAERFHISRQAMGNLCQAHKIKLKRCRLGAF